MFGYEASAAPKLSPASASPLVPLESCLQTCSLSSRNPEESPYNICTPPLLLSSPGTPIARLETFPFCLIFLNQWILITKNNQFTSAVSKLIETHSQSEGSHYDAEDIS